MFPGVLTAMCPWRAGVPLAACTRSWVMYTFRVNGKMQLVSAVVLELLNFAAAKHLGISVRTD